MNTRKLFLAGLAIAAVGLTSTAAFACADKLMVLSGATRLRQMYSRTHPVLILAYSRQNSVVPGVVKQLELDPNLKHVGYQLSTVDDPTKLGDALKAGKYDLVLVDAADAESLEQQVHSAASMPLMLPVVYKSTKVEAKILEKRFRRVLRAPASPDQYLAALDDAMDVRLKNSPAKVLR